MEKARTGGYRRRDPDRRRCMPWWWVMSYLLVLIVFVYVVVYLVGHGVPVLEAVGVPGVLSGVAVGALTTVARVMRPAV